MPVLNKRRPVRKVAAQIDAAPLLAYTPDLSGSYDDIVAELTQAFLAAFSTEAPDIAIDAAMKERAAAFARERATELIADLTDATRDRIRELVADAIDAGDSPQQLAQRLRDGDVFSRERAETISITETAFALGRGQRAAAEEMGQDEKQWVAGGPNECDSCMGNAGDGWIGIDETFSSGDDNIPGHPKCACDVIYRTRRVHEDAAAVPLVKVARCRVCGRKLGENVNHGARLFCQRCRDTVEVA